MRKTAKGSSEWQWLSEAYAETPELKPTVFYTPVAGAFIGTYYPTSAATGEIEWRWQSESKTFKRKTAKYKSDWMWESQSESYQFTHKRASADFTWVWQSNVGRAYTRSFEHKPQQLRKSEPIFVYDRNERLQLVLSDDSIPYKTGEIDEELNGAVTINIEVLSNSPEVEKIENEGRLITRDSDGELKEFIIRSIEDSDDGSSTKIVEGEGGEYDLIDDFLPGYSQPSVYIEDALSAVLQGTRWQVGEIDAFQKQRSIELKNVSVRKAVVEIVNKFEGDVKYRIETKGKRIIGRYIDVYQKRGSKRSSHRFEDGVDIVSSSRELDSTGIKTAMYGYGKSDANGKRLDFSDIEWRKDKGDPVDKPKGQTYVGDPQALRLWGRQGGRQHKFGFYDGQEEDPAELLLNTWRELQEKVNLNKTYDADVLNLGKMLGIPYYDVHLGDEVEVVNRSVYPNIIAKATVIEYIHNLNDSRQSQVKLGHFRNALDLSGRVSDLEKDYNDNKGVYEKKPEKVQNDLQQEINDEISKVDKNISKAKQDAQDAFDRANKAVSDAQDGFDKAQNAIKKANKNAGKYSDISKTVDSIATRVDDNEGNYSSLSQTVDGIQTRVSNNEGDISTVTQTASALVSRVGDVEDSTDSAFSQISQLKDDISLRVKKDDIVSQINLTPQGILLDANKINFSGKVFGDSGATFKGTVTAENIRGSEISGVTFKTGKSLSKRIHMQEETIRMYDGGKRKFLAGFRDDNNNPISEPIMIFGEGKYDGSSKLIMEKLQDSFNMNMSTTKSTSSQLVMNYTGSVRLEAAKQLHLNSSNTIHANNYIYADGFRENSSAKRKQNIKKFDEDATKLLMDTDVYQFNLNRDVYRGDYGNKKIGFVAEMSPAIKSGDGVEIMRAVALNWKASQEQQDKIEKLEKRVDDLELIQ